MRGASESAPYATGDKGARNAAVAALRRQSDAQVRHDPHARAHAHVELEDGHVAAGHVIESTTLMAIKSEVEDGEQVRGTALCRRWGMRAFLSCMAERGIPYDRMGAARVVHGGIDDPDAILKHTAHVRAAIGTAGTRKHAWR